MSSEREIPLRELVFNLYYNDETPDSEIIKVKELLQKLKELKSIKFNEIDSLSEKGRKELKDRIRNAATRWKFKVVSGGGAKLVISRKKKLNLQDGPILVVLKDDEIIRACPYGLAGVKGSKESPYRHLLEILNNETDYYPDLYDKSFTEQDLVNLIIKKPSLLEDGLDFLEEEVDLGTARIDLVFIDKDKNHFLVEIKLDAKDSTIGQVTRYNIENYSKKKRIPPEKIRKGIVTLSHTGQIVEACEENKIELFILDFKKIGYKPM